MSPTNDAREPVNENIGRGTGIGTLTPTYFIRNMQKIHDLIKYVTYNNITS